MLALLLAAIVLAGITSVSSQAAPGTTITIAPEADTYVSGSSPAANFGTDDHFDTYGGFNPNCVPHTAPAYGLLRFDLSAIPPGSVISDVRLVTTTRAGYAQDGDGNHHAIFIPDDSWSETGVTWNTRPSDGTVAAGNPTLTAGGDIRSSANALGSVFTFRATCGTDFAGNETKIFPTNDFDISKTFAASKADLIGRVSTERAGDGKLSLEIYNPNCATGCASPDTAYWARYWSREAADPADRPYLEVTFGPDNDTWTRAQSIALDGSGNGSETGSVDVSGQARWYRFPIQPGTRARVDLTNLPANYDVTLFTDIAQAFSTVGSTDDLQQLSAEFAGDAFSPSVFSPSVFSPSVFSPSVFSPSVFSPSVFSPSVFSPSVFSPSVFSPSVFSPSVFSPSVFSPSVFSPSVFSDGQAYESAQVRSVIAVSANDGTAAEHLSVDTWNNTGNFYVRVAGRNGEHTPAAPFDLDVHVDPSTCTGVVPSVAPLLSSPPSTGVQTLILADYGRMTGSLTTMQSRLATLQTAVGGKIVNLGADSPRVAALNTQADGNKGCPYAKNLVADAIRDVVLAYRAANPGLADIVVVGSDHVVPFFRYPDAAGLGPESGYVPPVLGTSASQASLRLNYYLSQDAYGAEKEVQLKGVSLPVPDLPVGRLVETPAEITGMIDAFLADSVLQPTSSLVTGYDFLTDGATAVQGTFSAGLGGGPSAESLITNQGVPPTSIGLPPLLSWTADRLRTSLLGARHDLVYLAGHFSANNLLAADYTTTVNAGELAASNVNLANTLVLSAGCHSGYTIVDGDVVPNVTQSLDWIQAFAQKRATLIAGTGYQYGDTDFLEYSERLYRDVAQAFRFGTGPVSVGGALVSAKQRYLAETPSLGGIHQKAMLEATLYGLPMSAVDLPSGRNFVPPSGAPIVGATSPVTIDPGATLGLSFADITRAPSLTPFSRPLVTGTGTPSGVTATWLAGPSGVVTNPGAPALPLEANNVTVTGKVLRGVGFRGGTFTDTPGVTPLTGAPATEINGVHSPFVSDAFFPSRLWSVNYFEGLQSGTDASLMLTPVQYRTDAPGSSTNVQRRFSSTSLRLFYSAYTTSFFGLSAALAAPPTIARVDADVSGGDVTFRVRAVGEPAAGMQQVWVTYTGVTPGTWASLDLVQDTTDSTLWTGTLTGVTPGQVQFLVQAVNGVGLVSLDDNQGAYYRPGQIPPALQSSPVPLPATSLSLSAPATAAYGGSTSVSATLTAGATPLQGQTVRFTLGGSEVTALTNASGVATVGLPVLVTPGSSSIVAAAFDRTTTHEASDASQSLTVTKLPTSLALAAGTPGPGGDTGVTATLTSTGGVAVPDHTVLFRLVPASGPAVVVSRPTGAGGKAQLGVVTLSGGQPLPPGTYTVQAYFGPNAALGFVVPADAIYDPSSASLATPVTLLRSIVFASARSGNGDLYVVGPTGGDAVQLTSGSAIDAEPEWSPAGDKIAFTSTRAGNVEIFVMNADGSNVTRLTTNAAVDTSPAWSPDGQKIAFASNRGSGNNWDVYVMNANGSGVTRLTTDKNEDLLPAWSPNGTQIAFMSTRTGNGDIYTMSAGGSSQTRRTTSTGIDTEPAWSGSTIAFSTNRHGTLNFEIYRMSQTGGSEVRLTNQSSPDVTPSWSSDGTKIVFASTRPPGGGLNFNLWTMSADGSNPTAIVTNGSADLFPDW
jgi:Tol biopolymer transport system component